MRLWCAMSGGKISPEIQAAGDQVITRLRTEINLAMEAAIQTMAAALIPLQQDVDDLKQRVRNLEQGGGTTPDK